VNKIATQSDGIKAKTKEIAPEKNWTFTKFIRKL